MATAKFNGKTYDVRETGKTIHSPSKTLHDYKGEPYETGDHSWQQKGLYDPETGERVATLNAAEDKIYSGGGKSIGGVKVKD